MSFPSNVKPSPFGRTSSSTFGAAPTSQFKAASGSYFGAPPVLPFTATPASASPFASASTVPKTSPFGVTVSSFAPVPSTAFTPSTPTGTIDITVYETPKIQELTLPVRSRFSFVERTTYLSTAQTSTDGSSDWFIKVEYSQQQQQDGLVSAPKGQIEVAISWHSGQIYLRNKATSSETDLDIRQYKSMSFIPRKRPRQLFTFPIAENALLDGKAIKGTIDLNEVSTATYAFEFDIVLSTATTLARIPLPLQPKSNYILPRFLKDPHSVDICFVFPNDRDAADVGLWAHRVVLSRSKVFAKMIDDAVQKAASDAATATFSFSQQIAAIDAAVKATTPVGARQENEDEGKMTRTLSNHEYETASDTSFTDIGSQADGSVGDQYFSETPDLSELECELGAVEGGVTAATIKTETNDKQESATAEEEKPADATTEAAATTNTTKSDKTALGAGPRTLTFVVDQVSLVVFLALLQYIYTGEINLAPSADSFIFSNTKPNNIDSTDRIMTKTASQQDREVAQWVTYNPKGTGKEPIYEDLMLAADLYGIANLAFFCQQNVELSLNSDNVLRILFDVAPRYPRIKAPALAFMVKSRATMFAKDADPFKDYRNHPDCYSLMLEVVQLLAASK
ncbi:hypothetical protein EC957_009561 [Mortierella hygrophila]|uniref:BTB domain-containing protein n=1 Tax=Mortierella hygrophila TaxID=979708 RepID=A0A9P6FC45_9FUNG|nr:hypothetical protein EC957_009561 [Mortierella hygrophila]